MSPATTDHDGTEPTEAGGPGPPSGSSTSGWLLMRFSTQMHGAGTRFALREALHPTDVQAMAVLAAAGRPLGAGELSAELELSTGATTRLVDRLERVGHLERHADADDKRRRLISVTPSAAATAGAYFGQLGVRVEAVLDRFDDDEQVVIERFLGQLVASMEDLDG
jgi:DNA-binding MarR family transcriptional regulator